MNARRLLEINPRARLWHMAGVSSLYEMAPAAAFAIIVPLGLIGII